MPRKKNSRLEIRIRALKVPKGTSGRQFLGGLLDAIDSGEMPRGTEVQLYWRNPETRSGRSRRWQNDDFVSAVADSSAGFTTLLRRMIVRRLRRA